MSGEHINDDGKFQSDKYPWCKAGFVPLKLTDPMAQPVLWAYANHRRSVDEEFAEDLHVCLRKEGYEEGTLPSVFCSCGRKLSPGRCNVCDNDE